MKPFETIHSHAFPIDIANCDTDQIVPGRFLSRRRSEGFGAQLFHDLRHTEGRARPQFALNQPVRQGARILLTGANFGCGSSRESAVWALLDHGIGVVLAPSFADIFFGNAFKNGLLPIAVPAATMTRYMDAALRQPDTQFEVDLAAQRVQCEGEPVLHFDIDALRKHMLLSGLDEIALTLSLGAELEAFERRYGAAQPWLARDGHACA